MLLPMLPALVPDPPRLIVPTRPGIIMPTGEERRRFDPALAMLPFRAPLFGAQAVDRDPYWANVVLSAPFNEAAGSTTFTDYSASAHTMTPNGNAQTTTTLPPSFQATSLSLDGTGDFVTLADSADWHFGSGDFTVEYFAFHDTTVSDVVLAQWGADNRGWAFSESTNLEFLWSTTGADSNSVLASFGGGSGTAHRHRFASRVGNTLYLGFNGTIIATADFTGVTLNNSTRPLVVGGNSNGTTAQYDGRVAALRITKGVGRYSGAVSSAYTIPTAPYPTS